MSADKRHRAAELERRQKKQLFRIKRARTITLVPSADSETLRGVSLSPVPSVCLCLQDNQAPEMCLKVSDKSRRRERGICGPGDDLPTRLSIVRSNLKAQGFHFQHCSRKSLSVPVLQSIYVVSIPGAVPPAESILI